MEREQLQTMAFGAGLMAVIIAIARGELPRWLRITLVLGLLVLAGGGGFYGYRYYTYPTTLTVAAGSIDGAAPQLMSAIATRLVATGAPVRLKVIDVRSYQGILQWRSGFGSRAARRGRFVRRRERCCRNPRCRTDRDAPGQLHYGDR